MSRTYLVAAVLLVLVAASAYPGGEAESGRDAAVALVEEGAFVASSYVDLESILDDYDFPYKPPEDSSLSLFMDLEKPLIPDWGDSTMLQTSIISAGAEHFPEVGFNYVVFPYSEQLFNSDDYRRGLRTALLSLLETKSEEQSIWLFLRERRHLAELTARERVDPLLEQAAEELEGSSVEKAMRRTAEAERDLQALLQAADRLPRGRACKLLWILDKPIAESAREIRDVSATIAGYGNSNTEISFLGHGEEFRAGTVNAFVNRFGGNSYYVTGGHDLTQTVLDDFSFYRRPAISDLSISVHALGAVPDRTAVRSYSLVSMGPAEHHVFFTELAVPSRLEFAKAKLAALGSYSREDVQKELAGTGSYPLAYLTVSYYDYSLHRRVHDSAAVTARYTTDFEASMEARPAGVARNLAVLDTYRLFQTTASQLRRGNYTDPLIEINSQIKRLEELNAASRDQLIAEDIALMERYKRIILENRDNPLRGLKAWREISRRRY